MQIALSADELKALKNQAMMAEKSPGLFSVRVCVVGGRVEAAHLSAIAELAQRFGSGQLHLTTRQSVEIPHVPYENLVPLREVLEKIGLRLAAAGKCVRAITACPGTYCKFGQCDTQTLAQELFAKFGGRGGLPHKFKIAVAGCNHGCTKPQENDLGIMATPKGFIVFVGGKMGKNPRFANQLPFTVASQSQLFSILEATLNWYLANGKDRERFGSTIDRLGIDSFSTDISSSSHLHDI